MRPRCGPAGRRLGGRFARLRRGAPLCALRLLRLGIRPAAGIDGGVPVSLHVDGGGRHAVEKVAVMADQQHRARVLVQKLLQKVERFDIKVVGRLVEHQQIAFARHQPGQKQPRLFTPRQRAHRPPRLPLVEQEILEIAHDMARLPAHHDLVGLTRDAHLGIAGQIVPEAAVGVEPGPRLVEKGRDNIGAVGHRAAVRRFAFHQQVQQRGLAHTVGADQGHAVLAQDADAEIAKDHVVAVGF